jgi:hypothetical protein
VTEPFWERVETFVKSGSDAKEAKILRDGNQISVPSKPDCRAKFLKSTYSYYSLSIPGPNRLFFNGSTLGKVSGCIVEN